MSSGSKQVDLLIGAVESHWQGQMSTATLLDVLRGRLLQLPQLESDLASKAERLGHEFLQEFSPLLHLLQNQAQAHQQILTEILGSVEQGDPSGWDAQKESLQRNTSELVDSMGRYTKAYWHWGPWEFPLCNLLERVRVELEAELPYQQAQTLVSEAVDSFESAQEQLSALKGQAGWSDKESAVSACADLLVEIENCLADQRPFGDELIQELARRLEQVHRADEEIFAQRFLAEPTPMPSANLVINCGRAFLDGQLASSQMLAVLRDFQTVLQKLEEEFEEIVASPQATSATLEELPKSRMAIDLLFDAVEDILEASQTSQPALMASAITRMEAAISRLHQSVETYAELSEREGRVCCPQCQSFNSPNRKLCLNCSAILPQNVHGGPQSSFALSEADLGVEEDEPISPNLALLLEACAQFYDGSLDKPGFLQAIERSRQALSQQWQALEQLHYDDLVKEQIPDEEDELARRLWDESKASSQDAIILWEEGLDCLSRYAQDKEFPVLEEGIEKSWQASKELVRIYLLAHEAEQSQAQSAPSEDACTAS